MAAKSDWEDGKGMSSRELVKEACQLLSTSGGEIVEFTDHNLFKVFSDILCGLFCFNKEIPTETRQSMMRECLLAVVRSSVKCDTQLAQLLRRDEQAYLRKPKTPFTLLSSFSLKYDQDIGRITTPTASFTFYPSRPRQFRLPDGGSVLVRDATPSGYSYVKVHVKARDHWGASEVAMNSLDLMRGLWNLYFNRQTGIRETWISEGGWKPVNEILPGPIHTLHTKSGSLALEGAWWTSYMPETIRPKNISIHYSELKGTSKNQKVT